MRPYMVQWLDGLLPATWARLLAPTWFTFVGLAGVIATIMILRAARRRGDDVAVVAAALLWGYLVAVAAGILVPLAIDAVDQLVHHGRIRLRWAGMVSFYGYLGGLAAVIAVTWRRGPGLASLGDLVAAPLGVALACARLGCFVAGCDYGKVTSLPWAMRFPSGSPAWRDHVRAGLVAPDRAASLPVHPTQLYEAMLGLIMAAVAIWALRQPWARARAGRGFLAMAATYALGRLAIEVVRGDVGRGFVGAASSGQVFAIAALVAVVIAAWWTRRPSLPRRAAIVAAVLAVIAVPEVAHAEDGEVQAGLLLGAAAPLNRRNDQVGPLAGPSLSAGISTRGLTLWLDLDSQANHDATHGTLLLAASVDGPVRPGLTVGGRFGLGATLVNFHEDAFRDVAGTTMRAEAIASWAFGEHWALDVRPMSFDFLNAADIGGPLLTWQFRVGVSWHSSVAKPRPRQPDPMPPPAPMTAPPMAPPGGPVTPAAPPPPPTPEPQPMSPYDR